MPRIARDARYEWLLLQSVYSIFERSLPPVNSTEKAKLKLHLVQGQANQYITKKDFRRFLDALKNLLGIFELFVHSDLADKVSKAVSDSNAPEVAKAQAEVDVESRYPRLVALKIILSICEPIRHSSLPSNVQLLPGTAIPSITKSLNDFEDKLRSSHFKYSEYKLADARIRGFNAVVDDLLQGKLRGSASKGRFNSLKDDEIVVIQDVEHCRSSFDSLFQLFVRNLPCSNLHSAWVHMSGFRRRELDVVIVACHDNQKHTATCRRQMATPSRISESPTLASSHQTSSTNTGREAKILCHQRTTQEHSQLAFNDNAMWHDAQSLSSTTQVTSTNISLRNLLRDGGVVNQHGELCEFEREDHKSVELLLAHSLLFLGGTPWLQSCVSMDKITSFPSVDADNALDRWRLHLPCDIRGQPPLAYDQIEQIYAFGVFLMEMETGLRAQSLPVEADYEDPRGGPRMDAILETMLAEWARKVDDGYLQVAKACLDFRESAEAMALSLNEHRPRLKDAEAQNLKDAATIFKLIVLPLERLLADRHAAAHQLFRNFSLHTRQVIAEEMSFYDDVPSKQGSPEGNTSISLAKVFLANMQASIDDVYEIAQSCRNTLCLGERVKIAILDTGVDLSDLSIKEYMRQKRIVECKGFAGNAGDVQDKSGHGTHVAKILIKNAPAADFYIAKVSNNTKVPASQLTQVAEAIKWALVDVNVDILSMSFGWHERNLQINKALGKAQDHQVMFAAASNDGETGKSGPTFPAQNGRVFCINACDGIGTPATFNPPALKGNSFMTLGLGIESYWKSEKVYKSGTSFATPMASAMVANALEFTRHQCGTVPIPDEACAFLNSFDGVRKLMELMINQSTNLERSHPYTYLDPSRIWDRKRDRSDIANSFIKACK